MAGTKRTARWVAGGLLALVVAAGAVSAIQNYRESHRTVALPELSPYKNLAEERLYRFVKTFLTDGQGGVRTNLMPTTSGAVTSGDTARGHAVLSESVGLLMEYAVRASNRELFEIEVRLLEQRFLTGEYFVRWVAPPLGEKTPVSTVNSSIDDLRLIGALLAGDEKFGDEHARRLAEHIAKGLLSYNGQSGFLRDFADVATGKRADEVSIRYLNLGVLAKLSGTDLAYKPVYEQSRQLLQRAQQPSGLYATVWLPDTGAFRQQDGEVEVDPHMAEQLVAALYAQEAKLSTERMTTLLKKALGAAGRLPATIDRDGAPATDMESPAVYALAAIYLHRAGEESATAACLKRLEEMQVQKGERYDGGYVDLSSLEAFSFDQLEALLALREAGETP
ncbi:hypothetical protein JJB07_00315 [Tumebacillus sp. ITR2]|uniref:Glycosyl hydrolase n=1 Tax=Tumebacillus amylolyticus TaxID=2801339 RepID=A0ABS1J473_9BACL|nr:hypothetical protein [Tumebacillus amylolyticus]MBL0385073.1 hypothetical protein [Tumebacillus amylolyticus]